MRKWHDDDIAALEEAFGCTFPNGLLLEQAFVHPSDDTPGRANYQRLEFLGDEVVGLAVSTILYRRFPGAGEGALSRARAHLIDEKGLADIARTLDLGRFLLLGKGEEKTNGRAKDSILADVFEALMAVVYLSHDWETVLSVAEKLFVPRLGDATDIETFLRHIDRDYKTRLQEIVQGLGDPAPRYTLVEKSGPDHRARFVVECSARGLTTYGEGNNRKKAEQEAARKLLSLLQCPSTSAQKGGD